tara:strand:- start:116801 stop:117352 length:552 start_codon:yes stop_codon:yes gene_type:complete
MAERFDELQQSHITFIVAQHLFFVGTAASEGAVNVSPKGMDSLRILDPSRVAWLNLTGSGNETAAHLLEQNRMTIMFCSFDKQPLILRLYGSATAIHPYDEQWPAMAGLFPDHPGARQVFEMQIAMVQTSCGYAVPHYDYHGERKTLTRWAEKRGSQGIQQYWRDTNTLSLDGFETGILEKDQ